MDDIFGWDVFYNNEKIIFQKKGTDFETEFEVEEGFNPDEESLVPYVQRAEAAYQEMIRENA